MTGPRKWFETMVNIVEKYEYGFFLPAPQSCTTPNELKVAGMLKSEDLGVMAVDVGSNQHLSHIVSESHLLRRRPQSSTFMKFAFSPFPDFSVAFHQMQCCHILSHCTLKAACSKV